MKKIVVEKIYKERYKIDANSRSLAESLPILINSTFNNNERILYELLQNADDAVSTKEGVHYDIHLIDNYLVVNYNGKYFDDKDLESLCDVGASSKVAINNKIGYKGIGFKSVFKISDCVWVVSDNTCIRFDKNYQNQGANGYPWQLIPIWTSLSGIDLPQNVQDMMQAQEISIIIKLKEEINIQTIKDSLNKIYGDYNTILFLRNIQEIRCYAGKIPTLSVLKTYNFQNYITSIEIIKQNKKGGTNSENKNEKPEKTGNFENFDKEEKNRIGRKGEELLYQWLKEEYTYYNVIWVNEEEENEKPYDILMEDEDKKIYVEVKATSSKDPKNKMFMSWAEYRFLQDNKINYHLYRISNIDTTPIIKRVSIEYPKLFLETDGYWIEITENDNNF